MLMTRVSGGFLPSIKLVAHTQVKGCVLMPAVTTYKKEMGCYKSLSALFKINKRTKITPEFNLT